MIMQVLEEACGVKYEEAITLVVFIPIVQIIVIFFTMVLAKKANNETYFLSTSAL